MSPELLAVVQKASDDAQRVPRRSMNRSVTPAKLRKIIRFTKRTDEKAINYLSEMSDDCAELAQCCFRFSQSEFGGVY